MEFEGHTAVHAHLIDITQRKSAEAINAALFDIANAVNTVPDLDALYRSIHRSLGTVIDVTNFFIALVDTDHNTLHFPYHVDTCDDDFEAITDFTTDDSLTGMVVSQHRPMLLTEKMLQERAAQNGIWGPVPLIWLGAPLITGEKIIGVVAVQSYTNPLLYSEKDLEVLAAVSHQMASAIERKKIKLEKEEAERLAEERNKLALIGQIAGKMAHDFNNILGVIMGHLELMHMDCTDPGTKETLQLLLDQTERGKNMTRNLVAFARTQEPRYTFFNINEKIDLALTLMKKDLYGIQVIKKYGKALPDLMADPGMMEHALVNLLQNAVHALGRTDQPLITLTTAHHGTSLFIEIRDNGCGIPKEHLDSIYEPAFTLKGSNDVIKAYKSDVKGTGYGMTNVKKYIQQHQGTLTVDSARGKGTAVRITLPVIEKHLSPGEKIEMARETRHTGRRILLVEDEKSIADVQYRVLTQGPCRHRVDMATTGQSAMDLFDNTDYDLISLDYLLPGTCNGMDVYHHIRKQDTAVPVLFISGNIEFLESIKALKAKDPLLDHLSKPCRHQDYLKAINTLLDVAEHA